MPFYSNIEQVVNINNPVDTFTNVHFLSPHPLLHDQTYQVKQAIKRLAALTEGENVSLLEPLFKQAERSFAEMPWQPRGPYSYLGGALHHWLDSVLAGLNKFMHVLPNEDSTKKLIERPARVMTFIVSSLHYSLLELAVRTKVSYANETYQFELCDLQNWAEQRRGSGHPTQKIEITWLLPKQAKSLSESADLFSSVSMRLTPIGVQKLLDALVPNWKNTVRNIALGTDKDHIVYRCMIGGLEQLQASSAGVLPEAADRKVQTDLRNKFSIDTKSISATKSTLQLGSQNLNKHFIEFLTHYQLEPMSLPRDLGSGKVFYPQLREALRSQFIVEHAQFQLQKFSHYLTLVDAENLKIGWAYASLGFRLAVEEEARIRGRIEALEHLKKVHLRQKATDIFIKRKLEQLSYLIQQVKTVHSQLKEQAIDLSAAFGYMQQQVKVQSNRLEVICNRLVPALEQLINTPKAQDISATIEAFVSKLQQYAQLEHAQALPKFYQLHESLKQYERALDHKLHQLEQSTVNLQPAIEIKSNPLDMHISTYVRELCFIHQEQNSIKVKLEQTNKKISNFSQGYAPAKSSDLSNQKDQERTLAELHKKRNELMTKNQQLKVLELRKSKGLDLLLSKLTEQPTTTTEQKLTEIMAGDWQKLHLRHLAVFKMQRQLGESMQQWMSSTEDSFSVLNDFLSNFTTTVMQKLLRLQKHEAIVTKGLSDAVKTTENAISKLDRDQSIAELHHTANIISLQAQHRKLSEHAAKLKAIADSAEVEVGAVKAAITESFSKLNKGD